MIPFAFEERWPQGALVAVDLPPQRGPWDEAAWTGLLEAERAHAATLAPLVQRTWVGGRLALARALEACGGPRIPLLATARGAVALPPGFTGSIAHKDTLAVAVVEEARGHALGVDVEDCLPPRPAIARKVLTTDELATHLELPEERRWDDIVVRFALKEALYKAVDRFRGASMGFEAAAVWPQPDGTAIVEVRLPAGRFATAARWWRRGDHVLAVVRARPEGR